MKIDKIETHIESRSFADVIFDSGQKLRIIFKEKGEPFEPFDGVSIRRFSILTETPEGFLEAPPYLGQILVYMELASLAIDQIKYLRVVREIIEFVDDKLGTAKEIVPQEYEQNWFINFGEGRLCSGVVKNEANIFATSLITLWEKGLAYGGPDRIGCED